MTNRTWQPGISGTVARRSRFLLLTLFAAGCGYDPTLFAALPQKRTETVILASDAQLANGEAEPGSYIVAFRAPKGSASRGYASYLAESRTQHAWLDERFEKDPRVKSLRYVTTVDLANPRQLADHPDFDAPSALRFAWSQDRVDEIAGAIAQVDFASAKDARDVLGEWDGAGELWFAEPNYVNHLSGVNDEAEPEIHGGNEVEVPPESLAVNTTNTQSLAELLEVDAYKAADQSIWWHNKMKLAAGLEFASKAQIAGIESPIVAVLDSGTDVQSPQLQGRIWQNGSPGASGCLNDVNGCDTTVGVKGVLGNGNIWPFSTTGFGTACAETAGACSHGTHVAGIIAAKLQGDVGGVCPVCKVMVIKIIAGKGVALDSAILNGLKYVTLFKKSGQKAGVVRVVNASFGKSTRSRAVAVIVSVLKKAPQEVLVVGAAGNEDTMLRTYPAALSDAIAVSSVAPDSAKATYSNFGPWVDVAAPGGDLTVGREAGMVKSTVPGGGLGAKQGTSMASPMVAGLAGLILAVDPSRSFNALRQSIIQTADPSIYNADVRLRDYYYVKVTGESTRRPLLGSGVVDVPAAVQGTARSGYFSGALSRVDAQCGVVGGGGVAFAFLALVGLGLPLLPLLFVRRGRRP